MPNSNDKAFIVKTDIRHRREGFWFEFKWKQFIALKQSIYIYISKF